MDKLEFNTVMHPNPAHAAAGMAAKTERSPEVTEGLAAVRDKRERLQHTVAILLDRLVPVMREEPGTPSSDCGLGVSAPLACALFGEAHELDELDSALRSAIDRLEI